MLRSVLSRILRGVTVLLTVLSTSACGQSTTSVNLHGVNYTGDTFTYFVMDSNDPNVVGGGEMVWPYAAGGTTCCATLPKKWRPGIKLQIKTVRSLPKNSDGVRPEVQEVHTVEVPRYVNGKPGELWVIRAKDGAIEVVSSDFQPDHPKWPGKVKGWPEPSLEYRRERWAIYMHHEEGGVHTFTKALQDLERDPAAEARSSWKMFAQHRPQDLEGFTGPEDPKYIEHLREEYREGLARSKRNVQELLEARP